MNEPKEYVTRPSLRVSAMQVTDDNLDIIIRWVFDHGILYSWQGFEYPPAGHWVVISAATSGVMPWLVSVRSNADFLATYMEATN